MDREPAEYYRELAAAFMHRPYHRMPETSLAMSYLFALAQDGTRGRAELAEHCERASMAVGDVVAEMRSVPDILQFVKDGNIDADAYPLSIQLLKEFRASNQFGALVASKMSFGSEVMKDIGNVYCAALPAWMAAGLEEAHSRGVDLAGGKAACGRLRQRRRGRGDPDDRGRRLAARRGVIGFQESARSVSGSDARRSTRACTTPARRKASWSPRTAS